jgi:hypothetical protein
MTPKVETLITSIERLVSKVWNNCNCFLQKLLILHTQLEEGKTKAIERINPDNVGLQLQAVSRMSTQVKPLDCFVKLINRVVATPQVIGNKLVIWILFY